MYTSGFTLIYRDEEQDWLFEDRVRFTWWLQLRMKAAYQPCVQSVGRTRVTINLSVGEFATTKVFLARMWDADERAIDSFLNLLEQDGRISMRRESNILIIKINQYERFSPSSGYFDKKKSINECIEIQGEMQTKMHSEMNAEMHGVMQSEADRESHHELQSETQTNKINNINLKTENNNLCECGREQEIELFKRLKSCTEEDRYYFCKSITCSEDKLQQLMDQFEGHIMASEEYHTNFARLKFHFSNWAKKEYRNDEIKRSRIANIDRKSEVSASSRRGTSAEPRSSSDYDIPFPTSPNSQL